MRLRDLKRHHRSAVLSAWPPDWGGSYGRNSVFPQGEEGVLIAVERMEKEQGLWLTIRFDGGDHRGPLVWDEPPPLTGVELVLQAHLGEEIKILSDVEV